MTVFKLSLLTYRTPNLFPMSLLSIFTIKSETLFQLNKKWKMKTPIFKLTLYSFMLKILLKHYKYIFFATQRRNIIKDIGSLINATRKYHWLWCEKPICRNDHRILELWFILQTRILATKNNMPIIQWQKRGIGAEWKPNTAVNESRWQYLIRR